MYRVKKLGRTLRGDDLSPAGKRLALLIALTPVWIASIVWGGVFTWVVISLLAAWAISFWVTYEHNCEGPKQVYCAPSGESEVAICHGCESWLLTIRGDERGGGKGAESLIARLRALSRSHSRDLPVVASELAHLADSVEKTGNLREEPDLGDDVQRNDASARAVPQQMEKIMEKVGDAISEGKPLGEALAAAGRFVGDSADEQGMAVIVDSDQFKRFQEFCKERGEDPEVVGTLQAQTTPIGPAAAEKKPKGKSESPPACQDCGQEVGGEHLKTCPHSDAGTVTEEHARASNAK